MSLRLQELKREVSATEAKLKTVEGKQQEQDQILATVNACWKQVEPDRHRFTDVLQLHRDLLVTLAKLDPFIDVQEPEVDGKKGTDFALTFDAHWLQL